MPDQEQMQVSIEEINEAARPLRSAKVRRTLLWVVPLVIGIVIVAVAIIVALTPAMGIPYSNITLVNL